jgi:hypothetical protein
VSWQLYEDVAHPEGFLETWLMESWTDHLRENDRLSPSDRIALARAAAFQTAGQPPSRFIAIDPARSPDAQPRVLRLPLQRQPPYRARTGAGNHMMRTHKTKNDLASRGLKALWFLEAHVQEAH